MAESYFGENAAPHIKTCSTPFCIPPSKCSTPPKNAVPGMQNHRKSIIDIYLETRPTWISFFQGSFWFFKIFSSSISYRAICDVLCFLMGCIGDKVKMDIKINFIHAISNYNYQTPIRSKFIMYSCLLQA